MTEECLRCYKVLAEDNRSGLCEGCTEENNLIEPIFRGPVFFWRGMWRGRSVSGARRHVEDGLANEND